MKPRCFVVSPIGGTGTPVRLRSDTVFRELIGPAVEALGYEPLRADMLADPGMISSQVVQHVVDDHLVVADLTGANPNVYYELALRHATRRPCVCLIDAGEPIPFDIAAYRVLVLPSTEAESLREARQALSGLIEAATRAEGAGSSPVATALREWRLAVPGGVDPRDLVDSLVLSYLHLSFTLGHRPHLEPQRQIEEARLLVGRFEAQLDVLTDALGMPQADTFRELERFSWKASRGEP